MGNKVDLAHIRAVKVEKHAQADMVGVFAWVVYVAVCMNSTNLVAHMLADGNCKKSIPSFLDDFVVDICEGLWVRKMQA